MRKGYLTVYLSLSLALILSFILTLIEGARISVIRMEAECVADIGMNSVLAEFHRELLEQYDLLFVDTLPCQARLQLPSSFQPPMLQEPSHNVCLQVHRAIGLKIPQNISGLICRGTLQGKRIYYR